MHRPFRQGPLPAVAVLAALLAVSLASPAGASSDDLSSVSVLKPSKVTSSAHTVRLVTGDRVVVTGSGANRQVSFAPDSDSPTGTASILRRRPVAAGPPPGRP